MTIQLLGTGCPTCTVLQKNLEQAIEELGLDVTVEHISDIEAILDLGVMMIPALIIDGDRISSGRALSVSRIIELLSAKI
ncbi:MAG: thioredoxin family protein [Spirochaetia bacterium]|nr:thioredoxin family protein [Spirochaetia bacterium]